MTNGYNDDQYVVVQDDSVQFILSTFIFFKVYSISTQQSIQVSG